MSSSPRSPEHEVHAMNNSEVESDAVSEGTATRSSNQLSSYELISEMHIAADFIEKLDSLKYTLETDLMACDAKWTLFVAAALSYRYDSQLKPFPPKFVNEQTGFNIDALVSIINDTPKLRVVLQNIIDQNYEEFDTEVLDLLHWVLVELRNPILRSVDENEFNNIMCKLPKQETEPMKPTHVFEVCPVSKHDDKFKQYSSEKRTKKAFYGNKLDGFFSIVQLGFEGMLAKGQGDDDISLSTELVITAERSPNGAGWGASSCGSMISCVALCEYIDDAELVTTRTAADSTITHIHVSKHDSVRVRYLLFYGSRFPDDNSAKSNMISWLGRHKYALSLACYTMLLTSIGIANSGSGHYIKHMLSKKAAHFFDFCKKIFVSD